MYQIVPNGWGDGLDVETHEYDFYDSNGKLKDSLSAAWRANELFETFSDIVTDPTITKFSKKRIAEQRKTDRTTDYARSLGRNPYLKTDNTVKVVDRYFNRFIERFKIGEFGRNVIESLVASWIEAPQIIKNTAENFVRNYHSDYMGAMDVRIPVVRTLKAIFFVGRVGVIFCIT